MASVQPKKEEFPVEEDYPFDESKTYPFYPPVCLREHWDRSAVVKHILPSQRVALPMDFRPYTKICRRYVTTAAAAVAPEVPADMVFPPGGEFYPQHVIQRQLIVNHLFVVWINL